MTFLGVNFAPDGSLDQDGLEARSPAGTFGQIARFPNSLGQIARYADCQVDTNKATVRVATQGQTAPS